MAEVLDTFWIQHNVNIRGTVLDIQQPHYKQLTTKVSALLFIYLLQYGETQHR